MQIVYELSTEDDDKLREWIDEAIDTDKGTHFAGMTYEDGVRAVLDMLSGEISINEVTGE